MKQNITTDSATFLLASTVMAVDLAKRVFQVAAEDAFGAVIYEQRIKSREAFAAFLRQLPAGLSVLMETQPFILSDGVSHGATLNVRWRRGYKSGS